MEEIEKLFGGLSSAEKPHILQQIVQDLGDTFPGIECIPGKPGDEPVVVRARFPV